MASLSFSQIQSNRAFPRLIDLLIEKGLLAGRWTAEDVMRALDVLQSKIEIAREFEGAGQVRGMHGTPVTDPVENNLTRSNFSTFGMSYEDLLFQRALYRDRHVQTEELAAYKNGWRQEKRADPAYREAETQRDLAQRATRRAHKRAQARAEKQKAREALLAAERVARKTALRARIAA
jgi:hypothetical protein